LPQRSPAEKVAALEALRQPVLACQKCPHLVQSRTQVVFGVGDPNAPLMFVGEAPGEAEDRAGEPFVGPAGQLLTKIIQAMGLSRDTVYIANILKCRPDMPRGSRGNRAPRPEEMDTCKPYLLQQIDIIQPRLIVALGGTAVQGLLGLQTTMGSVRGRWHEFHGIPVMPTFHPSYLLRSEEGPDRGHREKRKTWEDMLLVLERLQLPITEKMRGYFLKPAPTGGGSGG
jgi:DNA polymerase